MIIQNLEKILSNNEYPGRGIIVGKTLDEKFAVVAYWIMGRSENSRNRIFVEDGDGIRTKAFDSSRLIDPTLVIYTPVRVLDEKTIVSNGDQTDTIFESFKTGKTFEQSLRSRTFEDDKPNFTPRISAVLHIKNGIFNFAMSILKSGDENGNSTNRYTFSFENPMAGVGRYIHTYTNNGNPLPSFEGEPEIVELAGDIDEFSQKIWNNLNEDNKVSLFVRFIDIKNGNFTSRIINKNK